MKDAESFAQLIQKEGGKPIKLARGEVERAPMTARLAAEEATRFGGEWLALDIHPGARSYTGLVGRVPVGPTLAISPFNFPLEEVDVHGLDDKLDFLLTHTKPLMEMFIGWMDEDIHKLRYEDLLTMPRKVLAPIAEETGISLDTMVNRSKFRGGLTYRAGRTGDWKDEFGKHHVEKFKSTFGEIMDAFGYSF